MSDATGAAFLADVVRGFADLKTVAERALAQLRDEELVATLDDESNTVAIIIQHLAGNLRSRWTAFLTSDGEKPDRDRDGEFVASHQSRAALMASWDAGWDLALETLSSLRPDDLARTVHIRGQPMSVLQALTRQQRHAAYHVGQIVWLAKHFAGPRWVTLTIPRGRPRDQP